MAIKKEIILNEKEKKMLELIAQGLRDREIAEVIGLKHATIQAYCKFLLAKFNALNRTHLVTRAFEEGYLTIKKRA